jgi:hypothetical protein
MPGVWGNGRRIEKDIQNILYGDEAFVRAAAGIP